MQAQGVPLKTGMWGDSEKECDNGGEDFELLWAEERNEWVAVYKMSLLVCESFLCDLRRLAESPYYSIHDHAHT